MKIVVAGPRSFRNHQAVYEVLNHVVQHSDLVIQGGARGVDTIAKTWARTHGVVCRQFDAQWEQFGRFAGPERNGRMAREADALIAFWDGESPGTGDMIRQMQVLHKPIFYVRFDKNDPHEEMLESFYSQDRTDMPQTWVKRGATHRIGL